MKKDEIDSALGYYENNAPRMRYHWFRQCGLFVGSGVVEGMLQVRNRPEAQTSAPSWPTLLHTVRAWVAGSLLSG